MSRPIIYHNPRCRKSREGLKLLTEKGYEPEVIKYLEHPPDKQTLKQILQKAGLSAGDIVRKEEKLYKEQYKGKDLSEDEWLDILVSNPVLIQRPLVVLGDKACLGRPPEKISEIIQG